MKTVLAMMFLSVSVFGLTCQYEEGRFKVQVDGKNYEHRVSADFLSAVKLCSDERAFLYDGLEWTIFEKATLKFSYSKANHDFTKARGVLTPWIAALYDGASLLVYADGNFYNTSTKAKYRNAKLEVSAKLAALYDGDSWHVFSLASHAFYKQKSFARAPYARVSASDNIAAFFDGAEFVVWGGDNFFKQTLKQRRPTALIRTAFTGAVLCSGRAVFLFCGGRQQFISSEVENCDDYTLSVEDYAGKFLLKKGDVVWKLDSVGCLIS